MPHRMRLMGYDVVCNNKEAVEALVPFGAKVGAGHGGSRTEPGSDGQVRQSLGRKAAVDRAKKLAKQENVHYNEAQTALREALHELRQGLKVEYENMTMAARGKRRPGRQLKETPTYRGSLVPLKADKKLVAAARVLLEKDGVVKQERKRIFGTTRSK